jgi:hypothetical protein
LAFGSWPLAKINPKKSGDPVIARDLVIGRKTNTSN